MSRLACIHPGDHARVDPDRAAIIMAESGERVSFELLEANSCRLARMFGDYGLQVGSHIAMLMDNNPFVLQIAWAARRAGLYFTPVNWHLGLEEAAYVVNDCGAQLVVVSAAVGELASGLLPLIDAVPQRLGCGGAISGYEDLISAMLRYEARPLPAETDGAPMFYSSGTTGHPKGIKRRLSGAPFGTSAALDQLMEDAYGFSGETVYLCPGPLYHSAPLNFSIAAQRLGGTIVVLRKFDAELALQQIETQRVTHAQFVPTHFVRMLRLADEARNRYDLSSLKAVIHAGAPCSIDVKEQMISWLGPIVYEYYAGSEVNGFCMIDSEEWLRHRGSVGRSVFGPLHIAGPDGKELAAHQEGLVYFEGLPPFEYHNAPQKTAEAYHPNGWSTLGDIGYVDDDGYLYLTDRKSHVIISGGVNIYPQEVENALALHPAIRDVAVIGVPDQEFGEQVMAVIELQPGYQSGEQLTSTIIGYCRERIAHYKCPRSVDYVTDLPRMPNGKLLKRELRKRYWP